ncbi:nose resistant to fluoxetine protein 6-like isoform 2-T2 [Cochliomyia hominivorax]
MPRGTQKYNKSLLIVLLLIFLAFLPPSEELSFGWGGGGDDSKAKDVSGDASTNLRKISKKHTLQKKFKFHKIERIEIVDDDDDDEDGDVEDNNDDTNENLTGEEIDDNATNERADDQNGDDDEEEENDSQRDRDASLNSANNDDEEEEFQFKKARKADKKLTNRISEEKTSKETSKSFFSNIFGGLFGGESSGETTSKESKKSSKESTERQSKEDTTNSNGIIDWLLWLGERTGRLRAATESEEENVSAPTSSGKPPKPISMPKSSTTKSARKRSETNAGGGGSGGDEGSFEEAMSQESFDTLIRTLPNFVINPSDVSETECRQQLQIFQRQLRGHKLWTLQMLDSTGKVGNGLLRGNINQFGDFGLCTGIKTIVKVSAAQQVRIRGKYCLAHIETQAGISELKIPVHMVHGRGLLNSHLGNPSHFIPRYGVANWGVCVPSGCSGQMVQDMMQSSLQAYNTTGIEFHVEVNDNDCYVKHSKKFLKLMKKDKKFCATFLYILGLVLLSLSSLMWEHWSLVKPILDRILSIIKNLIENIKKKLEKKPEEGTEEKAEGEEEKKAKEKDTIEETNQETTEGLAEESPNENEIEETADDSTSENLSLYNLALEIFKSFSPQRTFSILLAPDTYDVQFPVFHVLKIAATFMLYLCLKFLMIGHMPIINRDQLVRTLDHPLSVLIRSPMIYADILLLISGFLSAYQLSEEMEQKSYIHLLKRLGSKVSRYLPTVYLLICFQTWILPYLSSGPLWTNIIGQNSRLCDDQWWRNLLSLQNAIDFEETCSPSTIQLALEVQLYILGPLIVWLFYTDADAGFFVYGALHAMSVAARFSRTNKEHLSMTLFHGINVSKFYRTANILYSSPISRATTYLLGIGAGIFQKTNQGIIDLTPEMIPIGWILACLGIFWCLWSPSAGMRTDFIYTSADAASYASWCPLVFGLSLCWFIFMFPKSENSIIRFLLSSRPILIISRLVLPMQLVMYIVVLYNTAEIKESNKFHLTNLINVQEIFQIFVGTLLVAFLIDVPSQNIRRLLINRIFIERPHHETEEQEPLSGAEPSDVSEEASDHVTSDTPEPPDNIWGSDAEEEEQKYITKRRSSLIEPTKEIPATKKEKEEAEDVEEEEEEEEEEEISETEEVKKRPETPPPPKPSPAPPLEKKSSEEADTTYRRRRRPLADD